LREYGGKGKKREKGNEQRGEREIRVKKKVTIILLFSCLIKALMASKKRWL